MMPNLTLKQTLARTDELGIPIVGDLTYRGDCKKEDSELIQFFTNVRHKYPQYESLIFHPENEFKTNGGSSYKQYAMSKAKGRMDGIADIICLPIAKGAPVFICELKRLNIAKSLASQKLKLHFVNQLLRLASQKQHGAVVGVALGADNAMESFEKYVEKWKC